MDKSTISMAMFKSFLYVYQRVFNEFPHGLCKPGPLQAVRDAVLKAGAPRRNSGSCDAVLRQNWKGTAYGSS